MRAGPPDRCAGGRGGTEKRIISVIVIRGASTRAKKRRVQAERLKEKEREREREEEHQA